MYIGYWTLNKYYYYYLQVGYGCTQLDTQYSTAVIPIIHTYNTNNYQYIPEVNNLSERKIYKDKGWLSKYRMGGGGSLCIIISYQFRKTNVTAPVHRKNNIAVCLIIRHTYLLLP